MEILSECFSFFISRTCIWYVVCKCFNSLISCGLRRVHHSWPSCLELWLFICILRRYDTCELSIRVGPMQGRTGVKKGYREIALWKHWAMNVPGIVVSKRTEQVGLQYAQWIIMYHTCVMSWSIELKLVPVTRPVLQCWRTCFQRHCVWRIITRGVATGGMSVYIPTQNQST